MGKHIGADTTFEEFTNWLATQPADAELAELAEAYESAYAKQQQAYEHQRQVEQRLRDVEVQLLDAEGKAWEKLIAERAQLLTEKDFVPTAVAAHRQRTAETHLRWLRRLDQLARAELEAVNARLDPQRTEMVEINKLRDRLDRDMDLPQAERFARQLELADAARKQHQAMQADRDRLAAAEMVARVIQARISMRYGDDLDLHNERSWQPALQRLTNSISQRQAVRPLVPA